MSFQRFPMALTAALVLASLQSCVPYKKSSLRFGSGDQKAVTCAAGEVVEDGA
ncbi:MAG: hypothetical protein H7318_06400 [Oligoflexus sp.]|nr:hypothetical protein [Oligoflexus sp.]